jgi:hypothetical protein
LVFAILNLVFGGLGLLCGLCGAGMQAARPALEKLQAGAAAPGRPDKGGPQDLEKFLESRIPAHFTVQMTSLTMSLAVNLLLVIAGLCLLKMHPMGRWASIAYGVLEIMLQLAVLGYNIFYMSPVVDDWFKSQLGQTGLPAGFGKWLSSGVALIVAFGGMTYAIALLIFMLLPRTARLFSARQAASDAGGPEQDYFDPDFRRERRDLPPES